MPYIDLHTKPFDGGTIAKLEIFEDYAEAWIPTWVMQEVPKIHVFDFFSGPGYDREQVPGSPIRLLEKILSYLGNFFQKKTKVVLHLNEFEPNKKAQVKFENLQKNCEEFLNAHPKLRHFLKIEYYNKDAKVLFFELLPLIKEHPSLVYLDQNGVKFIAQEYVSELEKLSGTDFLYFASSSYFKRLGNTEEFQKVIPFTAEELAKEKQTNMHRFVASRLRKDLPEYTDLKLFPFSIKKGANIYGIIFGAKHFRAVDKFLKIAWKRNEVNGEADFDIDDDETKAGYDLFGRKGLTKIEKFQADLEEKLLKGGLQNNRGVLMHTYLSGHIPDHANEVIKKIKGKLLRYDGRTAGVNYDNVFKKRNIVNFKLVGNQNGTK